MEGIRIKNNDIYRIEVNDKKEYIEFDLSDISLKAKCFDAYNDINKISEKYSKLIEPDMSQEELTKLEVKMFKETRAIMDVFLGEGACQKIFGDRNYYGMFDDLFEELSKKRKELNGKSHLDMLELTSEKLRNNLIKKYQKNAKNVI